MSEDVPEWFSYDCHVNKGGTCHLSSCSVLALAMILTGNRHTLCISYILGENNQMSRELHIMSDCIISMPISIGLEKNSPLKPRIDEFIQRVVEAGLVLKWLDDVMANTRRRHDTLRFFFKFLNIMLYIKIDL